VEEREIERERQEARDRGRVQKQQVREAKNLDTELP
jgi:hypothetical protein